MNNNLPPGVTESMIPGNRSEDLAEELFVDWMFDKFWNEGFEIDEMYEIIKIGIEKYKKHNYYE